MSKPQENYSNYQAVDFVLDDAFVAWVKHPTPALDAFWQRWILEHPQQKMAVQEAIQLVSHITTNSHSLEQAEIENIWNRLSAGHDAQTAVVREMPGKAFFLWSYWKGIAAAVVLLVGLAVWWQWSFRNEPVRTLAYITKYGAIQHIWLPDSSEIYLNANSRLTFQDNFSAAAVREVWIEGEAFCKVRKRKDTNGHPQRFIVHTSNVKIEVLGTAFNVSHRRGNSVVTLNSGKVQLTSQNTQQPQEITMKPGDLVSYSDTQKVFLTKLVNPSLYSTWVNHKFVFNQTTLGEIAQMLNDNYGMEVIFKQSRLSEKKFTATISSNSLNILLTALQESFNVHIEKKNSQLIISEKR